MVMKASRASSLVQLVSASTYDGFFLRDNLDSEGEVPAVGPYGQCPDLIQSAAPLPDPQSALSTPASWDRSYAAQPTAGANYYYARGLNGAPSGTFNGKLCLFSAPGELILFPSTWKNRPLRTARGAETVSVSAASGHIGVGAEPWVLQWPPSAPAERTFTSFVVQNTAAPIPTISDWLEMSQLLTQQLAFGWRNTATFDPVANEGMMLQRMGLTIPGTLGDRGTVQLILTTQGMVGDTVSLLADKFTPERKGIALQPTAISGDGQSFGVQVSLDPGFACDLTLQYWNTSTSVPAAGATITLTANYLVPNDRLERAVAAGVLDSGYSRRVANQLGVGPQAVAPLGSVTFLAVTPGS